MSLAARLRRLHAEGHAGAIAHRDEAEFATEPLRPAAVLAAITEESGPASC